MFFWEREYREARAEYRHPGHEDQSVHGKWAHGIKKGPAPGQGIPMSREDIMAARYSTMPRRIQERAVPEGAIGMRSPDGEFMVIDRRGLTSPELVKRTYDQMEEMARTYGARASAVNIRGDIEFNRDYNFLGNAEATMAVTIMGKTIDVKAKYLEPASRGGFGSNVSSPGLAGAKFNVSQGENVLVHEYGHVLTYTTYGNANTIEPVSQYGGWSTPENAAELFASYHYGGTDTSTVEMARVSGWPGAESRSRFFDAEYRHPGHEDQKVHGKWALGMKEAGRTDLNELQAARVEMNMANYGLTHEGMTAEVSRVIESDGPWVKEGMEWYSEDAKATCEALAEKHGVELVAVEGVMSALSARTGWPQNKAMAELVLSRYAQQLKGTDFDPDLISKEGGWGGLNSNVKRALSLLKLSESVGAEAAVDATLTRSKMRSFAMNIHYPGQTDYVTIDAWMRRVAMNSGGLDRDTAESFFSGKPGPFGSLPKATGEWKGSRVQEPGYSATADAVRSAASKAGISPDQAQAIYWVYVRDYAGQIAGDYSP